MDVQLPRGRHARMEAEQAELEAIQRERREFKEKVQRELLAKASLSGILPKSYDKLPLQPGVPALRWLVKLGSARSKHGGGAVETPTVVIPDTLLFRAPPSKPLWIAAPRRSGGGLAARRRLPRAWKLSFFQTCCASLAARDELAVFFASGESGRLSAAALDSVVAVKKSKVWSDPQKSRAVALSARSLRIELHRDLAELDGFCVQVGLLCPCCCLCSRRDVGWVVLCLRLPSRRGLQCGSCVCVCAAF